MGLFKRMRTYIKAKANDELDKLEDPSIMINQRIRDLEEKYRDAKLSSAQVFGNVSRIENLIKTTKSKINDSEITIQKAVNANDDDLARDLIVRKNSYSQSLNHYNDQYIIAKNQSDKLKDILSQIKSKIDDEYIKRDELVARYKTALASQQFNEIVSNVSVKGDETIDLSSIERKIEDRESLANGLGEVASIENNNSLDERVKKLNNSDVDAELAKYKKNKKS